MIDGDANECPLLLEWEGRREARFVAAAPREGRGSTLAKNRWGPV